MEKWEDIPGFEGYYKASNLGNIKSLPGKFSKGKILKPVKNQKGLLRVNLSVDGKVHTRSVSNLIFTTFNGFISDKKMNIGHIDGDVNNNNLLNLFLLDKRLKKRNNE